MGYKLTIEDINGNIYNFGTDGNFAIVSDPFDSNNNIVKLGYAPGGKNTADKMPNARVISLSGTLQADTPAAFETAYNSLKLACIKGGKLRKDGDLVSPDPVERYITVQFAGIDPGVEEGQQLRSISIDFLANDVFWFDENETSDANILAGNDNFDVDVTGTESILYPIIEIEADQGADLPGILLKNNSDGGMQFTYNNPLFVQGDILIIDCAYGTVKINSNDSIEFFDGAFLRLQFTTNDIIYEGNACTVRFKYRKAYY